MFTHRSLKDVIRIYPRIIIRPFQGKFCWQNTRCWHGQQPSVCTRSYHHMPIKPQKIINRNNSPLHSLRLNYIQIYGNAFTTLTLWSPDLLQCVVCKVFTKFRNNAHWLHFQNRSENKSILSIRHIRYQLLGYLATRCLNPEEHKYE
jgi:hypothetical protein